MAVTTDRPNLLSVGSELTINAANLSQKALVALAVIYHNEKQGLNSVLDEFNYYNGQVSTTRVNEYFYMNEFFSSMQFYHCFYKTAKNTINYYRLSASTTRSMIKRNLLILTPVYVHSRTTLFLVKIPEPVKEWFELNTQLLDCLLSSDNVNVNVGHQLLKGLKVFKAFSVPVDNLITLTEANKALLALGSVVSTYKLLCPAKDMKYSFAHFDEIDTLTSLLKCFNLNNNKLSAYKAVIDNFEYAKELRHLFNGNIHLSKKVNSDEALQYLEFIFERYSFSEALKVKLNTAYNERIAEQPNLESLWNSLENL